MATVPTSNCTVTVSQTQHYLPYLIILDFQSVKTFKSTPGNTSIMSLGITLVDRSKVFLHQAEVIPFT